VGVVVLACTIVLLVAVDADAVGPPQVTASWVEEVNATAAKLRGEIDANGLPTKYHFEYIADPAYQANPPGDRFIGAVQTKEEESTKVVAPLENLPPETIFHYRLIATNSAESVAGVEHIFVTEGVGKTLTLPDNRGWEMVSPVDKGGGTIASPGELFGGGDLQAAAAPGAVTYGSATAFGDAASAPPASQYVSRRSSSGWITENVSAPGDSAAYGEDPDGVPYRVFSADLSSAVLFGGLACRGAIAGCPAPNPPLAGSGAPAGYMAYYRRSAAGSFTSLLSAADVAHSAVAPANLEVQLVATNSDLSRLVLSSCAALTANADEVLVAPGRCDPAKANLYEWSASGLAAVNLLPTGAKTTPGAAIAAPLGAVSETGSRVYWSEGGELFLREGAQTVRADASEEGGVEFQTATADGSTAFFLKGGRIYKFLAATKAASPITPAGVLGVLGASADGSRVYFQDAAGLELWHEGTITTVAEDGAEAATVLSDYPPATATARISADGLHLAFLSRAALTGFDNIDAKTKEADVELYIYSAPSVGGGSSLFCASCNPTGERPDGSASIPGAIVNGSSRPYRPRPLSADGSRLFFETDDGISDKDTNGSADVYEWEATGSGGCGDPFGCVTPISSVNQRGGTFVDASADATDVYFLTADSLIGEADPGSTDLYDARVNGGFPQVKEEICIGDFCQPLPREPDDPTPGTLVPNAGNPPRHIFGPREKRRHHRRKHHKKHAAPKHGKHAAGKREGGQAR
jgi:hypothetical protein